MNTRKDAPCNHLYPAVWPLLKFIDDKQKSGEEKVLVEAGTVPADLAPFLDIARKEVHARKWATLKLTPTGEPTYYWIQHHYMTLTPAGQKALNSYIKKRKYTYKPIYIYVETLDDLIVAKNGWAVERVNGEWKCVDPVNNPLADIYNISTYDYYRPCLVKDRVMGNYVTQRMYDEGYFRKVADRRGRKRFGSLTLKGLWYYKIMQPWLKENHPDFYAKYKKMRPTQICWDGAYTLVRVNDDDDGYAQLYGQY